MDRIVVKKSYEVTLILLISITLITALRSMSDDIDEKTVLSLQLSTLVTVIASCHYFLMNIRKENLVIYRYLDWFFTTPILLIDFSLINNILTLRNALKFTFLNTLMLSAGFLGEMGILGIQSSTILGFIPFVLLFGKMKKEIDEQKEKENPEKESSIITKDSFFYVFVGLWSLYGLNHMVSNKNIKNFSYNILDILTKGAFGLFIYKLSFE